METVAGAAAAEQCFRACEHRAVFACRYRCRFSCRRLHEVVLPESFPELPLSSQQSRAHDGSEEDRYSYSHADRKQRYSETPLVFRGGRGQGPGYCKF